MRLGELKNDIHIKLAYALENIGIQLFIIKEFDRANDNFDEALKCYENMPRNGYCDGYGNIEKLICSKLIDVYINKTAVLAALKKYDDAIYCINRILQINPDVGEAFANLGIIFLRLHDYNSALINFEKAKEIFKKKGRNEDYNKADKYSIWTSNSLKILSAMDHIDKIFNECLLASSFIELTEKNDALYRELDTFVKKHANLELPEDVKELLRSKITCFVSIGCAINFKEQDINKLKGTKDIFKKWNLDNLVIVVNYIENFIYILRNYKTQEEIPKAKERGLILALNQAIVLDGVLTGKIFDRIDGVPYTSKPEYTGDETEPKIEYKSFSEQKKEWVRLCLVQLTFSIKRDPDHEYNYVLENKEILKKKIFQSLTIANAEKVDLICFPN